MSKIRGLCRDCVFLERELVQVENGDGQTVNVEDIICSIFDVFKKPDGYCDSFEPKELL